MDVQLSQHHMLRRLSFPHWMFLASLLKISWWYSLGFISRLSVLFHWFMCLLLCQYHTVSLLWFYSKFSNREVWVLQLRSFLFFLFYHKHSHVKWGFSCWVVPDSCDPTDVAGHAPALQADSLATEPLGKPHMKWRVTVIFKLLFPNDEWCWPSCHVFPGP